MKTDETAITKDQIVALSAEAAAAGDLMMIAICGWALKGRVSAIAECARVIAEAKAQEERDKLRAMTWPWRKSAQLQALLDAEAQEES